MLTIGDFNSFRFFLGHSVYILPWEFKMRKKTFAFFNARAVGNEIFTLL